MAPPPTRRHAVQETCHGVEIADPYRWLEDGDSPAVAEWVAQQNAFTRETLDAIADRFGWHERLVASMGLPVLSSVAVRGRRLFTLERPAGADQARLVVRAAENPSDETSVIVLADPGANTSDGAAAIDWFFPSPDGELVAVGTSDGGTERSVLSVRRAADGTTLADQIPDTRAATVGWDADSKGFLYVRYPPQENYRRRVYHHRLRTDWEADELIFERDDHPQHWSNVDTSPSGRWALVTITRGWSGSDLVLIDRTSGTQSTIIDGVDAVTNLRFVSDELLIGTTTLNAPRGRVVAVRIDAALDAGAFSPVPGDPADWVELIGEHDVNIEAVRVVDDELLVLTGSAGLETLQRYTITGDYIGEVPLPPVSAVTGFATELGSGRAFVLVDRFEQPPALWRLEKLSCEPVYLPAAGYSGPELEVVATMFRASDGVEIPVKIVRGANTEVSSATPTILYGYGGFSISLGPGYSHRIATWCAAGGQYVIVGLRGGNEFGEQWHEAGRRGNKQRSFDDFHQCAEWLIGNGYTASDRLAAVGGSNGGLLVGAAVTQRPDLYRAAWSAVPLLDMVRFPQFLIAKLWTDEYGDPDIAEEFAWLHAYSPYHNVVAGQRYPAVIFTTAEGDTRVDPLHARKMAAMLQSANPDPEARPVLLRQDGRAGHGQGKPVNLRASEEADALAFLWHQLNQ